MSGTLLALRGIWPREMEPKDAPSCIKCKTQRDSFITTLFTLSIILVLPKASLAAPASLNNSARLRARLG